MVLAIKRFNLNKYVILWVQESRYLKETNLEVKVEGSPYLYLVWPFVTSRRTRLCMRSREPSLERRERAGSRGGRTQWGKGGGRGQVGRKGGGGGSGAEGSRKCILGVNGVLRVCSN
jgi:uncharacterized membrane protein YgcG